MFGEKALNCVKSRPLSDKHVRRPSFTLCNGQDRKYTVRDTWTIGQYRSSIPRCQSSATASPPPVQKQESPATTSTAENRIDEFIREVEASTSRPHLATLKGRLRELSAEGGERFQEAGLKEFVGDGRDAVSAEDLTWHLKVLLALLNQAYQVQEEAALALAEVAAADPAAKHSLGVLGGLTDLRELLETPAFGEPVLAAAVVALGVAFRGSPGNACRVIREEDLKHAAPPRPAGLDQLANSGSESLRVAAGDVGFMMKDVFYSKWQLRKYFKIWMVSRSQGRKEEATKTVQKAIAELSRRNTRWKEILPHIVARQLVQGRGRYMGGLEKDLQSWGIALLTNWTNKNGEVVREACLPALVELRDSTAAAQQQKENAAWAISEVEKSAAENSSSTLK